MTLRGAASRPEAGGGTTYIGAWHIGEWRPVPVRARRRAWFRRGGKPRSGGRRSHASREDRGRGGPRAGLPPLPTRPSRPPRPAAGPTARPARPAANAHPPTTATAAPPPD